ncbi:tetratricopeptide repeat protein [Mucilaginibacter paludis]|nr:hypothetical protein [Mucilaginibacter paludis]
MKLKITLFVLFLLSFSAARAQTVFDTYVDFNNAVYQGQTATAFTLADQIINSKEKLPAKSEVNFYQKLGRLYETQQQAAKAIMYYERVAAAEPNYYTAQRALGYLYMQRTNELGKKLNASAANKTAYLQNMAEYKKAVTKCLPYLEKAQACDPDDQTLNTIKSLYHAIGDDAGIKSLDGRLKQMSANCVSLLTN